MATLDTLAWLELPERVSLRPFQLQEILHLSSGHRQPPQKTCPARVLCPLMLFRVQPSGLFGPVQPSALCDARFRESLIYERLDLLVSSLACPFDL